MFDDLLPQTCQVLGKKTTGDQWNPDTEDSVVILSNVPCRFDPLLTARIVAIASDVAMPGTSRGTVFISGNYGHGDTRRFSEKHSLKLDGYAFRIINVNDIWDASEVHHYEVEVLRGVNR